MQRTAAQTSPAGGPATDRRAWRHWQAAAAVTLAAAALFCAYLRLSNTSPMNSDSANVLLMGWDLLHGNVLLHGWYTADVTVYTTELPQYALLESFLGLHPETAHVAAAMTYTLASLLAILLAKNGTSGRTALVRMTMTGAIMVAPQLGPGVYAMDMVVDHIGTSVPLLLIWLLLDRAGLGGTTPLAPGGTPSPRTPLADPPARGDPSPRTPLGVPILTMILLTWVLIADPIVLVLGVAPLALVGGIRFVKGVWAAHGSPWTRRIGGQWYPLSLACAAGAAVLWARLAERLLAEHGGFTVNPVVVAFTPWRQWRTYFPPLWKVLQLYGADYRGLAGAAFAFAVLHLVSVALVGGALLLVASRFLGGVPLVDQVLAVAIGLNVVLYAVSDASTQGAHEIAIVAPFGAALAARTLIGRTYSRRERSPAAGPSASRLRLARLAVGLRLAGYAAGALLLAGYLADLGYELAQPPARPDNAALASWLTAHDLTSGLAGYWQASSVTVYSGGSVTVRALAPHSTAPYLWLAKTSWYDPASQSANFIVIDTQTTRFANWLPRATIERYAGRPARTYHVGPYIIMVWDENLLRVLPR